jgi:hypothetical protein
MSAARMCFSFIEPGAVTLQCSRRAVPESVRLARQSTRVSPHADHDEAPANAIQPEP